MTFRFMHAADIHLDSPLRGLEQYEDAPVAAIRGATRRAFTRLVTECIEQGVSFLLIVGDLYDGDAKDYKTALFFVEQMNRLREQGIGAYVVMGNHDAASVVSKSLRVPETVKIFRSTEAHTFAIESLNVALHGRSYARVDVSDDLSAHYPAPVAGAFNIGLLHTSADGAASEHAPYAPCSVQGLIDRGYQYWALGHVHRRRVLHDDPPVIFPGNLQGRNVRETGARGATLVTVDDHQRVHCEHRDLDVMRWFVREVSVEGADNATAAVDRVHASLVALRRDEPHRPLAVRIRLVGQCAAHGELVGAVEKWTHEVRARACEVDGVWIEKVQFATRTPIDLAALRRQPGALSTLLQSLDHDRNDPAALAALAADLAPLRDKLAALGDDGPAFDQPEVIRALLDDVEQFLVPMLLDQGAKR